MNTTTYGRGHHGRNDARTQLREGERMISTTGVHVALLTGTLLTTGALATYSWRQRTEHGAPAFVGLLVAFTLYSATHLFGLLSFDPQQRLAWEGIQWIATTAIPVFWTLFAMEYTGYDELIDRRMVGALSIVPAITVLLTVTNAWHGLMWQHNVLKPVGGLAILEQEFGPWFWVFTIYVYGLIGVGSFLLLRLVWISDYLYADQAALLVVGVAVPVLASALTVFEITPIRNPELDITPYSFAVTGIAFSYALFRRRLFELIPATRQLGRDAAIRDLDDGVVIVDNARRIIYLNPAAADQLRCEPTNVLGQPIQMLVGEGALDFDTEDALAELERGTDVYEVRSSPIRDRHDRSIGHTLVIQNITARKQRERQLAQQREELETLNDLNAVVRGVNRALVSATTRERVLQAVCDRLAASALYQFACAGDIPTWRGDADRWTVAGPDEMDPALPTSLQVDDLDPDDQTDAMVSTASADDSTGLWTVVPFAHGRTVYGALGVFTRREAVTREEREILAELGELVGHAINAIETRRLLAAEAVVELELACTDDNAALVAAASRAGGRLEVTGLVPGAGDAHLAYLHAEETTAANACEKLASAVDTDVRTIRDGDGDADEDGDGNGDGGDGGLIEWTVGGDTLLGTLVEHGGNVLHASAEDGDARYVVEVASSADVRSLMDRVRASFPETRIERKQTRERPIERIEGITEETVESLTDRQQDALEAAYRAGYFDWPRESTAEEVADALGITAPTLHAHLRKAEKSLLADLFAPESSRERRDSDAASPRRGQH